MILKRISATLLCAMVIHQLCFSQTQTYETVFGGTNDDIGTSLQIQDSIVYILGNTRSFDSPDSDYFVTAIDRNRNFLWSKKFGTSRRDLSVELISRSDGLYLLSQTVQENSSSSNVVDDVTVMSLNHAGELQWNTDIGINNVSNDEHAGSIALDDEGYVIMSAHNLRAVGGGARDGYIVKLDSLGNIIWSFSYNDVGNLPERIESIRVQNGSYLASGRIGLTNIATPLFLFKLDVEGNIEYWKNYQVENSLNNANVRMIPSDNNTAIISTSIQSSSNETDLILCRIDENGNVIWSYRYDIKGSEVIGSIGEFNDGGILLAGTSTTSSQDDALLVKVSSTGQFLWAKVYGGPNNDQFNDCEIDFESQSIYAIGSSQVTTPSINDEVFLVKLDENGESIENLCFETLEGQSLPITITSTDGGEKKSFTSNTNYIFDEVELTWQMRETTCCILTDTISVTICEGEEYEGYSEEGQYSDSFITTDGCDSTRILILTVDDSSYDCSTTSVRNLIPNPKFDIYPNPSYGNIVIELKSLVSDHTHLMILDVLGRKLVDRNLESRSYNLDKLPSGSYIAIVHINGLSTAKQFVVY